MSTEEDRYTRITLRIPKALHAKLQEQADRTSKSMNAEIIARVEASFRSMDDSAVSADLSPLTHEDIIEVAAIATKESAKQTEEHLRKVVREEVLKVLDGTLKLDGSWPVGGK